MASFFDKLKEKFSAKEELNEELSSLGSFKFCLCDSTFK